MLIVAMCMLSACQTLNYYKSERLGRADSSRSILIMPPDVELSELSAGGVTVAKADWTNQAREHMDKALKRVFGERQALAIGYKHTAADDDPTAPVTQLIKLHNVVGRSAISHYSFEGLHLPSKHGKFDWTLGNETKRLARQYGANFALFTHIRDSYTSGGRAAVIIAAALLGVGVQGGQQFGFATLVDLRSGEIVWFNVLARGSVDLRQYTPDEETVRALLEKFPT
ncbi:MAG: hypothetical protein VW338_06235 [Rhodospirillaceae bacterium]